MIFYPMYYSYPSAAPFRVALAQAVLAAKMVFPKSLSEVCSDKRVLEFQCMRDKGQLSTKIVAALTAQDVGNARQKLLKLVDSEHVELEVRCTRRGYLNFWEWVGE